MRILQVVPHYLPAFRFGGPLKVAHSLGKALVHLGHRVTVCTTNLDSEDSNLDVPTGVPVEMDRITVYYEPVILSRYWGFSTGLVRRINGEIAQSDLVLIHAHYQFANWIGAYLARRAHKPYIIFAHASLHRQGIAHKNKLLKLLYIKLMESDNLSRALFIAFNAPEEKANSLYGQLGRVIPNGVDPSEFAEMPPKGYFREHYPELLDKIFFLFLGRLDVQQKGLDLLVPAFARLAGEYPNAHLVLAGPDEAGGAKRVQDLARVCGIENRILLPGLISGQDKLAALQDADVFVLPSRFEGLSIALLEALYMGLPIVLTNRVGLCEEVERIGAGIIVLPDLNSVYAALRELVGDTARASMRGRGKELLLRKYSWDAIACDLLTQIQELTK